MTLETHSSSGSFLRGKGTYYISIAVLVLFIVNCVIIGMNRSAQNTIVTMQQDMSAKAAKVQQNQVFGTIYQGLLQSLGQAAVVKKDDQIKNLLSENGIQLKPKGDTSAPAAPAPSARKLPSVPAAPPAAD